MTKARSISSRPKCVSRASSRILRQDALIVFPWPHGSGHGKVADYWGEPFNPPEWRRGLSGLEDVQPHADEGGQDGDRSTRRAIENRREKEALTWSPRSFSPALKSDGLALVSATVGTQ